MALERKDVRAKLDPDDLERLKVLCDFDGLDIGEWVEQLILREIEDRLAAARKASSLTARLERAGKNGKTREISGEVSELRNGSRDSERER